MANEPAKFGCMCGLVHSVPRERALNGLSVAHWRCTDCGRRFVLTHVPPDAFTPVFLDPGVRSVEPRETGLAPKKTNLKNPVPPPALEFTCRCGKPVTVHSFSYNASLACPHCRATIYAAVKYNLKTKEFVVRPGYARSGD
jgi:DNA-directed RNA polymerase subunit RPC12/RpoP